MKTELTEEQLLKIIQKEADKMPKIMIINKTHYFIEGPGGGVVSRKAFDEAMNKSFDACPPTP